MAVFSNLLSLLRVNVPFTFLQRQAGSDGFARPAAGRVASREDVLDLAPYWIEPGYRAQARRAAELTALREVALRRAEGAR